MHRGKPLLMGWNRSPCTRRVAISMYHYGIEFDIGEPFAAGERLTQADVTTGVMVGMYRNMHQHLLPAGAYRRLDALADRCNAMPEFQRAPLEDVSGALSKAEPHLAPQQEAT